MLFFVGYCCHWVCCLGLFCKGFVFLCLLASVMGVFGFCWLISGVCLCCVASLWFLGVVGGCVFYGYVVVWVCFGFVGL